MKKIICKKEYDTETATLVKKRGCGFSGDPATRSPCTRPLPVCISCMSAVAKIPPIPAKTSCVWPRLRSTIGWRTTDRIHTQKDLLMRQVLFLDIYDML